jgi:hypothetical protein
VPDSADVDEHLPMRWGRAVRLLGVALVDQQRAEANQGVARNGLVVEAPGEG